MSDDFEDEEEVVEEQTEEEPEEPADQEEEPEAGAYRRGEGCQGRRRRRITKPDATANAETCAHYDWCSAEEEGESDDKVVVMGMTQGEMKSMAKGSVELAREGALAAKELKEAMDDIMGGLDINRYLK